MNDLRRTIAELTPQKLSLLERRLEALTFSASGGESIPRRDRPGPCPLSFAQQRLWFLDQMEPHSCLYNIPTALRLRGTLHIAALRQALSAIVARHEVLRTTFVTHGEEPAQVVAPYAAVDLPARDLCGVPAGEREAELGRVLRAEARRPFDLTADLMLRALLVRLDERERVLLLTVHHIACDGWSMDILARELSAAYAAYIAGRAPTFPPLPIQYDDYAVWQRQRLQGAVLQQQLGYWTHTLQGAPPVIELPTDRPRSGSMRT